MRGKAYFQKKADTRKIVGRLTYSPEKHKQKCRRDQRKKLSLQPPAKPPKPQVARSLLTFGSLNGPCYQVNFYYPFFKSTLVKNETVLQNTCSPSDIPWKIQTKLSNYLKVLEELKGGWKAEGEGGYITILFFNALFHVLEQLDHL